MDLRAEGIDSSRPEVHVWGVSLIRHETSGLWWAESQYTMPSPYQDHGPVADLGGRIGRTCVPSIGTKLIV